MNAHSWTQTKSDIKPRNKSLTIFMLLSILPLLFTSSITKGENKQSPAVAATIATQKVASGSEQLAAYLPLLQDKKVGLLINQTSVTSQGHLLDVLLQKNIDVTMLFAPEHGVRGDKGAGEFVTNGKDTKTNTPIFSIYGSYKKPPAEIFDNIDVIIFDIQDVGTRFYTYVSSMHYMMEAAAENDVEFIVLDRPNPNGKYIDGPVLELEFQSFVGMHQIPILHGLTVGELALMIKGEKWIEQADKLKLSVISVLNYNKSMSYSVTIPPSPNLPNDLAIQLYPSLCFFEATGMSIGRGTDLPFQVLGHTQITSQYFLNADAYPVPGTATNTDNGTVISMPQGKHTLNNIKAIAFTPISRPHSAPSPKLENQRLDGLDLRSSNIRGLDLSLLIQAQAAFKARGLELFSRPAFMDKLSGTDRLRKDIQAGKSEVEIRASWTLDLANYKEQIKPYELY
ncbi:MAG: hypothetical protein ACI96N_000328 [Arenicella sp.]